MTKLSFESSVLTSRLVPKLDDTVEILKKLETRINGTRLPKGFNSSEYQDAVLKIKNISKGLLNVKDDVVRAVKNFEAAEAHAQSAINEVNLDYRVGLVDPIIKVN